MSVVDYSSLVPQPRAGIIGNGCNALSLCDGAEMLRAIRGRPFVRLSRMYVYAKARVLGALGGNNENVVVRTYGIAPESVWGFSHSTGEPPSSAADAAAAGYKMLLDEIPRAIGTIPYLPFDTAVEAALNAKCPVVAAYFATNAMGDGGANTGGVVPAPGPTDYFQFAHQAVIIGRDSDKRTYRFLDCRQSRFYEVSFDYFAQTGHYSPGTMWVVRDVVEATKPENAVIKDQLLAAVTALDPAHITQAQKDSLRSLIGLLEVEVIAPPPLPPASTPTTSVVTSHGTFTLGPPELDRSSNTTVYQILKDGVGWHTWVSEIKSDGADSFIITQPWNGTFIQLRWDWTRNYWVKP